jgi:heme exporter protein D
MMPSPSDRGKVWYRYCPSFIVDALGISYLRLRLLWQYPVLYHAHKLNRLLRQRKRQNCMGQDPRQVRKIAFIQRQNTLCLDCA